MAEVVEVRRRITLHIMMYKNILHHLTSTHRLFVQVVMMNVGAIATHTLSMRRLTLLKMKTLTWSLLRRSSINTMATVTAKTVVVEERRTRTKAKEAMEVRHDALDIMMYEHIFRHLTPPLNVFSLLPFRKSS